MDSRSECAKAADTSERPVRAFVCGQYTQGRGGVAFVCEELSRELAGIGWTPVRASAKRTRLGRAIDVLATAIGRRRCYDVVIIEVYSGRAFWLAEAYSVLFGWLRCPIVLSLHGGGLAETAMCQGRRVKRLLANAAVVTTPSRVIEVSVTGLGIHATYLPNGLDLAAYRFSPREHLRPKLVWMRAFHRVYDPMLAVEVVRLLVGEWPDVSLTMFGPDRRDGTMAAVKRYVREQGMERSVEFGGPLAKADVPCHLERYDIFLNTTTMESFGVGVMEAAACGLIVVTRAVGELPFLWKSGVSAELVPGRDPKSMALAVAGVLRDPKKARRLSQAARETATRHDWSAVLPTWKRVLQAATGGTGPAVEVDACKGRKL